VYPKSWRHSKCGECKTFSTFRIAVISSSIETNGLIRCYTGDRGTDMKGELTAIVEKAPEGGYWAICPEVPGANGQGETIEEAKESLRDAVALILEDRLEDIKRGLPDDAIEETIAL
jgi:predicted RNase H-like HicB family nuclease